MAHDPQDAGVSSFGINAWTATEDDQQIIGEHDEASDGATGHEELYLVVNGHALFTLDDEAVDAPQGTIVHVPDPAVKRGATGTRGTTILAVGARPGEAFTPSGWERSAEALRFWPTEEWDRAIEVLERTSSTRTAQRSARSRTSTRPPRTRARRSCSPPWRR